MVEQAGVNVDELIELLVTNAAAELTTSYYYTILRANLIGLDGETIKEIAEAARIEDRNHFEALGAAAVFTARDIIEDWRKDYNEVRPHSSLKGSTPKEYAEITAGL